MNTVKIYRDGKDLYLTKKNINELEYEEVMGAADSAESAIDDARSMVDDELAEYIWLDTELLTPELNKEDIGVFFVDNGSVIECDKGGITC